MFCKGENAKKLLTHFARKENSHTEREKKVDSHTEREKKEGGNFYFLEEKINFLKGKKKKTGEQP